MISLIIPTHNPKPEILERALASLRSQTLPLTDWELLIIDNASTEPLSPQLVEWHPQGRVIREENLGLTHARLRGIKEARYDLLAWCDDDNILIPEFLIRATALFQENPQLGAGGGKSIPEFLVTPEPWFELGLTPLGCRDLGEEVITASWSEGEEPYYPKCAPIGAGLIIRKKAIQLWVDALKDDPRRLALGRKGDALTSGEDNDINLTCLSEGWTVGYFPQLSLVHIIPGGRLTLEYQKRMARVSFRDFIRVLDIHGIRQWSGIKPWSVPLRAAKAWLKVKPWRSEQAQIKWQGTIGQFEGRAMLDSKQ